MYSMRFVKKDSQMLQINGLFLIILQEPLELVQMLYEVYDMLAVCVIIKAHDL